MIIRGNTVGTTTPKTNWNQTDPTKADYLVGREDLALSIQNALQAADDATLNAGKANTAASNAQTAADNAQATADSAASAVGNAQTAATNAQTAASNAQTTANEANTAIDNHAAKKNNPHEVTCEQIGAATKAYADTKISMTLLWENASPSSAFAYQKIPLDLSEYSVVAIDYNDSTGADSQHSIGTNFCKVDEGKTTIFVVGKYMRKVFCHTDGVEVGNSSVSSNTNGIPLRIYGIKGVIE